MKAVVLEDFGDATVMKIMQRDQPVPKPNEVLIEVCAAGVNRADIAQRKGNYPAPKGCVQDILGLEVSGTIVKTGSKVNQYRIGDRVCALLASGGYAEYVSVDVGSCLPIPKGIDLQDAAALPEALFTVWYNIFTKGKLQKGEKVLIYGASGGVGAMAIQLCSIFGAQAFGMVSSDEKSDFCKDLGAAMTIDYNREDMLDILGENAVHLILDCVGGNIVNKLKALKKEGRLLFINAMEDGRTMLNIFLLMQKRISITGTTLRGRSEQFKATIGDDILKNAYPIIEGGGFKNTVKNRFQMEDVVDAHLLMESRNFMGKIILYW